MVLNLFIYRMKHNQGHERDFLTVGSMGHAASLALGIALKKPNRQVCLPEEEIRCAFDDN